MLDTDDAPGASFEGGASHARGPAGLSGRTGLAQGSGAGPRSADDLAVVTRRLVLHVGGYEPLTPEALHRRFLREIGRFGRTWSLAAAVSPAQVNASGAAWHVATTGPNWRVETDCRLLRWDDLIAAAARRPSWQRIPAGLLAFADFVAGGALWGYLRTNWRYALFFLYPYVLFATLAALAIALGVAAGRAAGSTALGLAVAALAFAVLLRWPGRRLHLPLMFDDWIFARGVVRGWDPVLEERLEGAARDLVTAARAGAADEIVVVGHSLGAVLAVDLVARALRLNPELGRTGPPVALLSVGSSIPKIGLHRAASPLRAAVARIGAAPGVFWAEYQAIIDVMNFYKTDPVTALGLPACGKPVVRVVRISRMLDPAYYRRIKRDFFRLHRQFVSGNDRRTTYDYFMLLCGPVPVEAQVRAAEGSAARIGPDGALLAADAEASRP